MSLLTTSSQTVGPYVKIGFDWLNTDELAPAGVDGERVTIEGRVQDGDRKPVTDAIIEIWQADARGHYPSELINGTRRAQSTPQAQTFRGFGRIPISTSGEFRFHTIKPGRVAGPNGALQAPHLTVGIFMRGLLKRLVTRIYFPDDPANVDDPILRFVPADRRNTLIAKKRSGATALEWNVILQGNDETIFFDI